MEKRKIEIDINTAREWFNSGVKFKKELALLAFAEEELTINQLPKSWQEYKEKHQPISTPYYNLLNTLENLLIIRDVYRQGWKPNFKKYEEIKYAIVIDGNELRITKHYSGADLLSFPTEELALQFLENFKTELEELKNLL